MNNTVEIHNDGINVYTKLEIKANSIGKSILLIFILVFITVLILVISTIEKDEIKNAVFPIIIISALIIIFPLRYLIWNFFGRETLIVNTKTISYNYDYGVMQTNLKTIPHSNLGFGYEFVREYDGIEKGRLIFYNYREKDNLPEVIHQTTILASKTDIEKIQSEISNLYYKEIDDTIGYFAYPEN